MADHRTPRASSTEVCSMTVAPPAIAGRKLAMFRDRNRLLPSSMTLKKRTNSLQNRTRRPCGSN